VSELKMHVYSIPVAWNAYYVHLILTARMNESLYFECVKNNLSLIM